MKRYLSTVSLLALLLTLAVSFQNCGTDFETKSFSSPSQGDEVLGGAGKGNPFLCANPELPGTAPLARLTREQYSNTVLSALGSGLHAQLKDSISTLYNDQLTKSVRDFRGLIDDTQISAYQSVAERAYLAIVGSATAPAQLGGACMSAATVTADCKATFVKGIGKRFFRRPLAAAETTKYTTQVFDKGLNAADGVAMTVYALMISPDFLLRLELGNPDDLSGASVFDLSPYEVASRLSYFLWDAPPDDKLMQAADAGQLKTTEQVSAQVDRMLADPRAQEKIKDFFRFWLDPKKYPATSFSTDFLKGFDVSAANTEFEREMFEYIDYVLFQKKGTFEDLLTGAESFARTGPVAAVYGHAAVTGNVPAKMGVGRKGLFMRAPVIATEGNETHPILRGVKFKDRFLCDTLGLPAGVMTNDPTFFSDEARKKWSTRTRTEGLTSSVACMACHSSINPFGFALENFDGLGRFRGVERSYSTQGAFLAEFPIDTTVHGLSVETGTTYNVNDGTDVIDRMIEGNKVPACFVQQVYRYYQIKAERPEDGCQLRAMYDQVKAQDYNGKPVLSVFKELLIYPTIFKRRQL